MQTVNSLKFGTSGLRGLAVELEGPEARRYVAAFIQHLKSGAAPGVERIYLGADFRPSSPAIVRDCASAIAAAGLVAVDCGTLPTPALALHAMAQKGAAIMVTGSHIPADRNGLKFYLPSGEISKADEAGILSQLGAAPADVSDVQMSDDSEIADAGYRRRFAELLPQGALAGMRIGVYQHSTVARDLLGDMIGQFGATIVPLGRIDGFVPVDTEAFADPVLAPLAGWVKEHNLDAIVSADGDGDRPLLMDSAGQFVRGDVLGMLTARFLQAHTVVTPVTSNSGIEKTGYFDVVRTRVGSPFVVEAMETAGGSVVGFEANGGTFVGPGISVRGELLPPLPTRDAVLPLLCALGFAAGQGKTVAEIAAGLPLMHAVADRLQDVPSEWSAAFLERLRDDAAFAATVFEPYGITRSAAIDGLQFWTRSGDMVHFRASGNAPELRCYVEASTAEDAHKLLAWGLETARQAVR